MIKSLKAQLSLFSFISRHIKQEEAKYGSVAVYSALANLG